ncbi:MAG: N-acetylmuramoyl-L-alanine amidase [Oscillospiraceae bacterium]|nr:N-acetylmuramoyl-L-alanine amidase [Oscillospiraceae bacterium]
MKKILKRILCASLALSMAFSALTAYAEPADGGTQQEIIEELAQPVVPTESRVFMRSGMRAVTVTPGVDYCVEDASDSALASELPVLVEELTGYGMNTVLINSDYDGNAYYDLDINSGTCVLGTTIQRFREAGLSTFVILDVNAMIDRLAQQGIGIKSGFSAAMHKFVMKYACDGIILSNYYTSDTPEMFSQYMECGSGIGYQNWLYETNEYIVRSISEIIRRTNNTVAVGLLISDMWANSSVNEQGSQTQDTVQSLYDGFSDTKKYIEKNYSDFVLVKAYGTTGDYSLNFDNVVKWWYDLTEANGDKTYVLHLNERIGSYNGWYEDQLLRQLTVLEDYENIGGSAFNSFASLKKNPLGTTDTLLKYFAEQINTETIFEDLEMISPTSLSFVTYDASVKFMGTFDENFDVYFDGEKIKLNEAGNFYFQEPLQVGWNSFVIEHKGKTYNYSIERRVDVMTSVEDQDVIVEGGTQIALVAVAYSGSQVSATIAGQTINLKEKENSGEELDANSSYAKFVGYYTVGDGLIGQEQYLGDIVYYASFSGYSEQMSGGSVTIQAKPEPPKDIVAEIIIDQSAVGTGEVVGTMPPIITDTEYVQYVKVLRNYTTVYDAKTTGKIPSPLFSQLPAGTLDYVMSQSGGYFTTTSGKRFAESDVTTFTDTGLGENKLLVKAIGNSGGKSFIKLHLDYKSSFNVVAPVTYHDALDGPYGVRNYDADKVYITFDNVTSVTKLPDFTACSLFSSGTWETVTENGVPKFRLALTLTQAGIFSGCGAYYDDNGDLMLTFAVPTNTLSGKVIVIDPGHGYGKTLDWLDPGAIGNVTEFSVNLAVAKKLEDKLTALGATVIRLNTESDLYITTERPNVARTYGADMFISLHCNSATNLDAHGVEVYYFTSFSQPLAKAINNELSALYDNQIYADGTVSSRGDKYSYYWVTLQQDFPSVLVEMGFISNERECMVMADDANQGKIAEAIANGVYTYFARSDIHYSGNGSEDVPDSGGEQTQPPEETQEPDLPSTSETSETTDITETADTADTADTAESVSASETDDTSDTSEPPMTTDAPQGGEIPVE